MKTSIFIITAAILIIQTFIGITFFVSSILEKETRASIFAGAQACLMFFSTGIFFYLYAAGLFNSGEGSAVLTLILLLEAGLISVLSYKTPGNPQALKGSKGMITGEVKRFDERDHVFARNRSLPLNSDCYTQYYSKHPELEQMDARRRQKGGPIGIPGSIDTPNSHSNVAGIMASLSMPQHLSAPEQYTPEPHIFFKKNLAGKRADIKPEEASLRLKGYAKNLGADLVGITKINPLWIYSRRGEIFNDNWDEWGKKITVNHDYAIVFATQMHSELVGSAPHTPTCVESMVNYAKGAYISTQVAAYIANLGFSATANHFRHYDGLMVPLAIDAGLGEMGRNGYLITEKYGPRIRLSLITTDLQLTQDTPVDLGVKDFCNICKKCAVCCPSKSIPQGEQVIENSILRWKIDAQSCFEYWGKVGTDCNICMNVCPWSHADTFPHRLIKTLISRNSMSRRLFNFMDDIFYGKRPKPKPAVEWAEFK